MPAWNDDDDERERQRQREADRIASEKNPPKPSVPEPTGQEMSYAERLKYWNEKVKAGQQKSHWTGD